VTEGGFVGEAVGEVVKSHFGDEVEALSRSRRRRWLGLCLLGEAGS